MGQIRIEGLGVVEIEGDTPNDAEMDAILGALQEQPEAAPEPAPEQPPQEGPLGLMPTEARGQVREAVEEQPGILQFLTEMGPSFGGAVAGGAAGIPLGPPGIVGGAIIGGVAGEVAAQETGVAPRSDLNLGLAAAGPVAGKAMGGALRLGRRAVGAGVSRAPFARSARAQNTMAAAVDEFESVGTRILQKQTGLMAREAGDLYNAVRRAGVQVNPQQLQGSNRAITELQTELGQLSAFPEVKQAIRVLDQVKNTVLGGADVSIDNLVRARQLVGAAVARAESAGGVKAGAAKKAFAAISDDLDNIAASSFPSRRGARLAKAAVQRAKLEFAVKDMEAGVARFVSDAAEGGTRINITGLQKWLRNVTNPASRQFDKNFATALKDEIPAIKERLVDLAKITGAGGPGGPGSLVVRGKTARMGGAVAGGLLGLVGAGPVGAGFGAVAGAQVPEMLVGLLTSPLGARFLERAAQLGKGQINARTWTAIGQLVTRSFGESEETSQSRMRETIESIEGTPAEMATP